MVARRLKVLGKSGLIWVWLKLPEPGLLLFLSLRPRSHSAQGLQNPPILSLQTSFGRMLPTPLNLPWETPSFLHEAYPALSQVFGKCSRAWNPNSGPRVICHIQQSKC